MERVDTLRYAWEKLSTLAVRSTCKACSIQVQELVYMIIGINVKLSCDFTATLIYFGGKCMKGVRREQVYHAKSGPGDRFWLPKVVLPCQKWYYLAKSGTTLPNVVLPCQKWYYLAKSGTTLPKVVLPCQKWYYLAKVVLGVAQFWQTKLVQVDWFWPEPLSQDIPRPCSKRSMQVVVATKY